VGGEFGKWVFTDRHGWTISEIVRAHCSQWTWMRPYAK
jgi:hypothetical protein